MQSTGQDAGRRERSGGISLQTLLIASVAAAAASYVVSRVWGAGTIVGAAATPVIVALVAEFLRKPVETVSATAKRVPVVQRVPVLRSDGSVAEPTRVAADGRVRQEAPPLDPGYVASVEADAAAARPRPRWGLVLATGAAAFAIVVGAFTVPDLVAGKSILGGGDKTTFFGGSRPGGGAPKTQETKTVTEEAPATVTQTTPATTTTVPGETTTTPPATTAPEATTPTAPTTTTPPAEPPATTPSTAPTEEPAVPLLP